MLQKLFKDEAPKHIFDMKIFYSWCLLARVILLSLTTALVTWGLFQQGSPSSSLGFLFIGITFGISAVQAILLRQWGPRPAIGYFQLGTDVVLAAAVLGISQSNVSIFLFLLVIIASAGALGIRGAVIVATFCSLSFSAIESGVIPIFSGVRHLLTHELLLIHLSFLVAGVLSTVIGQKLRQLTTSVLNQAENIRELREREERLLTDLQKTRELEEKLSYHERVTSILADSGDRPPGLKGYENLIIGQGLMMKNLFHLIERVAPSDASVLVTGESGTGKELIARAIHDLSDRSKKPFVAINCGAIPETLIESELFGHKKGAFTGAISDNPGLFRKAQGGTLFLDEVGELPLSMQTKLLRALQEQIVRSVGEVNDTKIDVRIVAATNRDLKKEIAHGRFREDLYYRLNVVNLVVPPLRDRKEDLPLLIRHFLAKYSDADVVVPTISPEALQALRDYPFPGNIRELENVIERALVLGGSAILPEHLPDEVRRTPRVVQTADTLTSTEIIELPIDLDSIIARFEQQMLYRALERTGGMKKQAAELLGMNFRSFRYRLKKYNMGGEGDSTQ
jgi:two-component system response regulator PilR (NtrC family)